MSTQETVYAIASGKGGVGKTTTTVNLGTALAGVGNQVVIVDADLGMANLAGFVSLNAGETSLHDVLSGSASVEEATYELANGIWAIPSGVDLEGYADVSTEELTDVVAELRDRFDFVLLDVGAGVSHETVLPLGLADATLLVTTTEPASVQDASKTVDLVGRAGGTVKGIVVTRTRPNEPVTPEDVAAKVEKDLLVAVPEDDTVRESVHAGTPLVVYEPKSPAAQAYRYLAARLLGTADEDERPRFDARTDGSTTTGSTTDDDQPAGEASESAASADDVSSAISELDGDADDGDRVDIPDAEADYGSSDSDASNHTTSD
jgi:septum site-determining protein MinD